MNWSENYSRYLFWIATGSIVVVLFLLVAGSFGRIGIDQKIFAEAVESSLDVVLKLGALAVVALLLPHVNRISKFKFGDAEVEFAKHISERANEQAAEIARLKTEIAQTNLTGNAGALAPITEMNTLRTRDEAPANAPTPELPQITIPGDPNKERFGGLAERDGYRLSVRFNSGYYDPIVSMELVVERTDGEPVEHYCRFFLHPTFVAREVTITPADGRCRMPLLVWGGFTVGVWVVGTETLLELDLEKARGAPLVIKKK
ncbi:MAG: hypothetical protein IPL47_04180 [Phyllobacteriaceae bacterium]|nr:hypothetical protein [Phyllobacteriaceae bacterium]